MTSRLSQVAVPGSQLWFISVFKIKIRTPPVAPAAFLRISLSFSRQTTAPEKTNGQTLNLLSHHCRHGNNNAITFIGKQVAQKDSQYGFALLPAPALRPRPPESFISTLILRLAMVCPSRAAHAASALCSNVKLTNPKPLLC